MSARPLLWTNAEAAAATQGTAPKAWNAYGVSIDSRSLEPGDLYVALKGPNKDGHDFTADALSKGAAAALVSTRPDAGANDAPLLVVEDTQTALEALGRAARARSQAKIVAVTGSAGKTTTKEMLRLILARSGSVSASVSSFNNHWGVPLSLSRMPREAQYGVFELGMNYAGEIRALVAQVRPHVAIITTIAPAHLEYFGNVEAIADAKAEIFEGLEKDGTAILPADNPQFARLKAHAKAAGVARILSFGSKADCDARLLSSQNDGDGQTVDAGIAGKRVRFAVGAAGAHIAMNAIAGLLAAYEIGADVASGAEALSDFAALKGRGARFTAKGVEVIDESYNANPASMSAALALLGRASPKAGARRIAVLGDMLELGERTQELHRAIAADIAAAHADLVFLCGANMKALWEALPAANRGSYAEKSLELAPKLLMALKPGDAVLVKGSFGSRMSVIIDALRAREPAATAWGALVFYHFLVPLTDESTIFNVFRYLTFRTGGALLTALFFSFCFGQPLIRWLKLRQGKGQPIRTDGPQRHIIEKQGTPTMGGLLILISLVVSTLLWADLTNRFVWIVLLVTLSYGLLGFADDYLKVTKRSTGGVSGKVKLIFQFLVAGSAVYSIMMLHTGMLSGGLAIPFFKEVLIPLGYSFIGFGALVVVGSSNAVNLTDGLDGLAIVPVMIASGTFLLIAYLVGNIQFANYLQINYVAGTGELAILMGALIGAGLGFLWYNAPPAMVFMGDTGSLALGGVLGVTAVAIKHEIVLAIVGGLFVMEAVSVIVQVVSFKTTGRRVFRMAPIHHHFEQLGWREPTIVIRFWIISVVLALIGLSTLKLR